MFDSLSTILSFIVAICILVAVHEFGHFFVARLCGVKVLRFSIGFGPRFFSFWDKRGTEFALSAIPLGGYVKMLDEREGSVPADQLHLTYNHKSVWQRIAIAIAGPLANFILAIVLYWLLMLQGTSALAPLIAKVDPGSIAASAGLEAGQEILAIDNVPLSSQRSVAMYLLNRLGESGEISFVVKYPNSELSYESTAELDSWLRGAEAPDPLAGMGLHFVEFTASDIYIQRTLPQSPAARAGLIANDKILAVDGEDVSSLSQFIEHIEKRSDSAVDILLERAGENDTLRVTPKVSEDGTARIGAVLSNYPPNMVRTYQFSAFEALGEGMKKTWDMSGFVLVSMKKLVLGQISTKNLSGPIGIAKVAGDSAKAGIWAFVGFLAMISVYLGVLNLLPIPVLDGGHIVYCLIESIKGSPVSEKVQVLGYQLGLFMILGLMVVAFYNDILRLLV